MTAVGDWRLKAILRRFEKLKGRSVGELSERVAQAVASELEYRGLSKSVREASDDALWALIEPGSTADGVDKAAILHAQFAQREQPRFFPGVRDGSTAAAMRSPRWSHAASQLVAAADAVLAGRFDLLGHRALSFGSPIDWHLDPVAGKRAPLVHWSRIPYLDAAVIGDHKVIWEINRHQHLVVLGRAYQLTGRAEYAHSFSEHVTSWMNANPPKHGVNWASSLEVSYRAIAWIWAMELFRDAPQFTAALNVRMLKFLHVHGRHLERYLSTYFSPNTHLTGEALGLLYLGTLLPQFRRAPRWSALGWSILERELPRHVHADGVYFEQSTYYHRYTLDIYLHAIMLADVNGREVPAAVRTRLGRAADCLADFMRPDGTVPIIGDDDGGRLIALEDRGWIDVRSALATAAVVLHRPALAPVVGTATEELLWLQGPDGVRQFDVLRTGPPPAHTSTLFREGGYAIMRDGWGEDAKHAVIDCGPFGAMNCGHAHSDALALELSVAGCELLVDPGTYTYTVSAADRDHFRHSAAHNTVTVDDQAAAVPSGPFSWSHRASGQVESWWSGGVADYFVGSHAGFERLAAPARHRRTVLFVRGEYWLVFDSILSNGPHEAVAHYHLAPGSEVTSRQAKRAWIATPGSRGWQRLFFAVAGDVDSLDWDEDWVSPAYGIRGRAPRGRLVSAGQGRRDLIAVLVPGSGDEPISVQELQTNQGRAVVVDRPDVRDLFLFSAAGTMRVEDVELDGDAALVRRAKPDGGVHAVALFGADARLTVDGLTVHAVGAMEATRGARRGEWVVRGEGRVTAR